MALRQSNITRWPTMRCAQKETVLEHSAIVSILAMLIGQYAKENGDEINEGLLMYHALMHDAQEIICGDTITPTKRANPTIHAEFKKIEAAATTSATHSGHPSSQLMILPSRNRLIPAISNWARAKLKELMRWAVVP